MPNLGEYYTQSGWPATNAAGDSASARSELALIYAGFDKLPALAGFSLKLVRVTATANGLEAVTPATALLETYADAQGWTHSKLSNMAGTNTITANATPTLTAYVTDQVFVAEAAGANTGAATINVDGVGALNLVNADGTALEAGDIPVAGYPMMMQVRAANVVLLNPYHSVKPQVHAAPSKATPADSDEIPLLDSASSFLLSKLTWLNLKTTISNFISSLYITAAGDPTYTNSTTNAAATNWTQGLVSSSVGGRAAVFSANGNWTAPAGVYKIRARGITPGGGGGGPSTLAGAGAGGAGTVFETDWIAVVPNTVYAVSVAGGAGGTAPNPGIAGQLTIGAILTLAGGTGGSQTGLGGSPGGGNGGAGGAGANGNPGLQGGPYPAGTGGALNGSYGGGGGGASTVYAKGGNGANASSTQAGGGGGGASYMAGANASGITGGAGGSGLCIIEW